jgi:uracil-DNA glycosylase
VSWTPIIDSERAKPYYQQLKASVDQAYEQGVVYPPKNKIFNAFALTPLQSVKVVILGQDPYHNPNEAQGLAFSTPKEIKNPPSMRNMLQEIEADLGRPSSCLDGDLTPWAKEGVLLINTILTVNHNSPKSHHGLGWEIFTDTIISYINDNLSGVVFLLWGSNAIAKQKLIDGTKHHVLTAPHPSPLSAYRGFFGCKHFSRANELLEAQGKEPINW